jgi:Macrocin-O-methyltransferase (TylF)
VSHVPPEDIRDRYLRALSAALMGSPPQYAYRFVPRPHAEELQAQFDLLREEGVELVTARPPSPDLQESGAGWLPTGMTMLGAVRLEQLRDAVETVLSEGVEGDLIETGVWRGGGLPAGRRGLPLGQRDHRDDARGRLDGRVLAQALSPGEATTGIEPVYTALQAAA